MCCNNKVPKPYSKCELGGVIFVRIVLGLCQLSRSVPAPHCRVPTLLWPFSMPLQRPFAWLCFSLYPSLNLFITSCFVFSIHLCKPPNALIATGFAFLIPFAKRQSKARELHQTFPANPSTLPSPYPILTPPRGGHNSPRPTTLFANVIPASKSGEVLPRGETAGYSLPVDLAGIEGFGGMVESRGDKERARGARQRTAKLRAKMEVMACKVR